MPCFGFSWMTYLACTQIPLNFSLSEAHVKTYCWTRYSEHSRTVQDLWWQQKRYKEPRGNRNSNCLFKLFPVALQFIQAHKLSFSLFSLISVSVGLDFLSTDNPNQEDLSITSVNKWGLTPSTEREEKSQNRGCWRDQQTGKYKFTLLYWPCLTEAEIGSTVGYQTCMFCSARSTLATKIHSHFPPVLFSELGVVFCPAKIKIKPMLLEYLQQWYPPDIHLVLWGSDWKEWKKIHLLI